MPYDQQQCDQLRQEKADLTQRLRSQLDLPPDERQAVESKIAEIIADLEANCGPKFQAVDLTPTFPYTHVGYIVQARRSRVEWDGIPIFAARREEMDARRRIFEEIADAAFDATKFYSFARGGMPLMDYVARNLSKRLKSASALAELRQRLFMLPSYKWRQSSSGTPCSEVLLNQLEADASAPRVVIADMSFTGDTITSIRDRVIKFGEMGHALPTEITLYGILDSSRFEPRLRGSMHDIKCINGISRLTVVYRTSARLITEDELALLGYERVHDDAILRICSSEGALIIYDDSGAIWAGTSKMIAPLFVKVLHRLRDVLERSHEQARCSAEALVRLYTKNIRRNTAVVKNRPARELIEKFHDGKLTITSLLDNLNGLRRAIPTDNSNLAEPGIEQQ